MQGVSPSGVRKRIGQLLIAGFNSHQVPPELRSLAKEFGLGGVILFARNVEEPEQVAELAYDASRLVPDLPLWVSIDKEGGRVARLKHPFTEWPPAITLGRSGSEKLAERFASALASELSAVGINLDYAPVLDVHTNPANPVIGDRALAEEADVAARLGRAVVRGLQQGGVAACGKHFPGHGDTSSDSHEELPVVEHDRRRLDAIELVPFRAAIEADVATLMTAHVLVPALDAGRAASLSSAIVTGLLKRDLGYHGLVLSDDLGMKAISATVPLAEACVRAIEAGCDAVLLCNSSVDEQMAALEALIRAGESARLSHTRLDDAFARQQRVKQRFLAPDHRRSSGLDVVGCAEHLAVAEEMAAFR